MTVIGNRRSLTTRARYTTSVRDILLDQSPVHAPGYSNVTLGQTCVGCFYSSWWARDSTRFVSGALRPLMSGQWQRRNLSPARGQQIRALLWRVDVFLNM